LTVHAGEGRLFDPDPPRFREDSMPEADTFVPTATPVAWSKYTREYERGRVQLIGSLIDAGGGREALDIGCGPGYFAEILSAKNWRVTAVDTYLENLSKARPFAATVLHGDALTILSGQPDSSFDLVLALELIEHMPRDLGGEFLRMVRRILRPGGTLILSTPNRWSLEGLGNYYWGERIRRWGKWEAWDATHAHIYSSREIVRAIRKAGLRVTDQRGYWYRGHLPLLGSRTLPLSPAQRRWPWNGLGFNTIVKASV
jgi:2-polyprenyl-3-methyl-5-hydroxy-6-metoxy-1,4-benzoquinol methylase